MNCRRSKVRQLWTEWVSYSAVTSFYFMSECLSQLATMKSSPTRERSCLRTQGSYEYQSHRFPGKTDGKWRWRCCPQPASFHAKTGGKKKSTDKRNLISDSFCLKWKREGQKQNPVAVSAVRCEYLGSAAPSEFLSPLSRITVSRNWKQREIQILTLQDICVTLATLN